MKNKKSIFTVLAIVVLFISIFSLLAVVEGQTESVIYQYLTTTGQTSVGSTGGFVGLPITGNNKTVTRFGVFCYANGAITNGTFTAWIFSGPSEGGYNTLVAESSTTLNAVSFPVSSTYREFVFDNVYLELGKYYLIGLRPIGIAGATLFWQGGNTVYYDNSDPLGTWSSTGNGGACMVFGYDGPYVAPVPVYSIDVYWDSDFTSANLMSVNPSITALSKSENSVYDIHTYVRYAGALYGSGSYVLQTTDVSLSAAVVTTGNYTTRQAVPSGSGHYLYDLPAVTETGGVRYQGLRVSIEFSPTNTTTKTFLISYSGSGVFVTPSPPDGGSSTGGSYGFLDNDLVLFILALLFIFVPPMLVVISVPKVGMAGFMLVLTGCAALGVVYLGLPFYFLVFVAIGLAIMFYSMLQRS